ncbi:MAG: hypothetical protein NTX03_05490 [Bacteroidetes bacterium]|nr:hypothetical protein [Bacteroidota bacterium]
MAARIKFILLGFVFFIAIVAVMFACNKTEDPPTPNMNYDYYPIRLGEERIYQVDSINYNYSTNRFDSLTYEIREVTDSPFTELNGDKAFKVVRYYRRKPSDPWEYLRTNTTKRLKFRAEKMEENTRYIKLIFPIRKATKSWNGNLFNDTDRYGIYNYYYQEIGVPANILGKQYDSTCLVHIIDYADGISKHIEEERYAKGVGLIYKYHLDTSHSNQTKPFPDQGNYANYKIYLKSYK